MLTLNFSTISDCSPTERPTKYTPLQGVAINMDGHFGADKWYALALARYYATNGSHPTPLQAAYIHNSGSLLNSYTKSMRLEHEYAAEKAIKSDYMALLSTDQRALSYDVSIGLFQKSTPEAVGAQYHFAFTNNGRVPVVYTLELVDCRIARLCLTRLVTELQRIALMANDYGDVGRADGCVI